MGRYLDRKLLNDAKRVLRNAEGARRYCCRHCGAWGFIDADGDFICPCCLYDITQSVYDSLLKKGIDNISNNELRNILNIKDDF